MYIPPTINLDDIYPMTEFVRNAAAFTKKIKKSKNPAVLTVNGRAELVVMDRAQYAAHLREQEAIEDQMAVWAAIDDIQAGRTRPAQEVFDELTTEIFGKKFKRTKTKVSKRTTAKSRMKSE